MCIKPAPRRILAVYFWARFFAQAQITFVLGDKGRLVPALVDHTDDLAAAGGGKLLTDLSLHAGDSRR